MTLDTTPPDITIASPSDSSFTNQQQITVNGTLSESVSALTLNGDTVDVNPDSSFSVTVAILEDANEFTLRATDLVGNSGTESFTITGDFHPPEASVAVALGDPSDSDTEILDVDHNDTLTIDRPTIYLTREVYDELTEVEIAVNSISVPTEKVDSVSTFAKQVGLDEGINTFELLATDQAGNVSSTDIFIKKLTTLPSITITEPSDGFETGHSSVTIAGSVNDTTESVSLTVDGQPVSISPGGEFEHQVSLFPGDNFFLVKAVNANSDEAVQSVKVVWNYDASIPPDPQEVAPPVDSTVVTTMQRSTKFLYQGDNPIQRGVVDSTIEPRRASVVRGKVLGRSGSPLSGVLITVLQHPEYGYTITREDGRFDMAVNGGGDLTLKYEKDNYLSVQRQVDMPWQDYTVVDNVVMTQVDPNVTTIDFSDSTEVARGSVVADEDGSRQATLMFEQGTEATMVMPDGSTKSLSSLDVRATEYTVGDSGPASMPAKLPPTSGYTYAVEFSVDEALEAGATKVTFDKPVANYVENFVGFPVGTIVPTGYYDRQKGQWIASENGRVIEIINISNGVADLDIDGDGSADPADSLSTLGIDNNERKKIASLYSVGESLWRVEISHFTSYDYNWPDGPPQDAEPPMLEQKLPNITENDKSDKECGSVISVENQTLGEFLDISGAPCGLYYNSKATRGFKAGYALPIELSGNSIPSSLKRINLKIEIAGTSFDTSFAPQTDLTYDFEWNGRDIYGRLIQGARVANVSIGYVYNGIYKEPADLPESFANLGQQSIISDNRDTNEITFWQIWSTQLVHWFWPDFGGWQPGIQHQYDFNAGTIYEGNGTIRAAESVKNVVRLAISGEGVLGDYDLGGQNDIAVGPDGSVYISFQADSIAKLVRKKTDGTQETIIETTPCPFSDDKDNCAVIDEIDIADNGTIYFSDNRIHKVDKYGNREVITGSVFRGIEDIAVAEDGSIYVADDFGEIIKRIGPDGSLYIADGDQQRIRKVTPDGIITTVAGSGSEVGDGGPATSARLQTPYDVVVGQDGSIYLTEIEGQIRKITSDGIIYRLAGLNGGYEFNNGPAAATRLNSPFRIDFGPDNNIYFGESVNDNVRMIESNFDHFDNDQTIIASQDGTRLFEFDLQGRHLTTRDALTDNIIFKFSYDSAGRLSKITDIDGLETTIERDTAGIPTAIIAPFGQRTELTMGPNGYLTSVKNPEGETFTFSYTEDGLLTEMTDPKNNFTSYQYDSLGYFRRADYPNGGFKELSKTETEDGFEVTLTTAEGSTQKYKVEQTVDGSSIYTNTDANGLETTREYGSDGSITVKAPDSTTTYTKQKPDPRFGMQAPLTDTLKITTPLGLTSLFSQERTITQMTGDKVTGITDKFISNGKVTVSEYDGNQNLTTTTSPEGRQTFSYTDSLGRIIQSVIPGIEPVNYTYDSNGFLTETEQGGRTTEFTYTTDGYLESTTDPLGRTEATEYDSVGRVTKQILPNSEEILYEYDSNGNLSSITPPGQPAHTFEYTEVDLTDSYTPPAVPDSAGGINYLYNLDKQLVSTVFSDSSMIQMVYDTTNGYSPRPTKIIYDQGTTSFDYDNTSGNLTSIVSSDSVETNYGYDGSLTTQIATQGPVNGTIDFTYNNDFQVTSQSINGANTVGFSYDDDGLLVGAGALSMSYDAQNGLLKADTVGNVSSSYSYNSFGELTGKTATYNGSDLYDRSFTRDSLGRITSIAETIDGQTDTYEYSYNDIGYLVQVKKNGSVSAQYEYDANGNRIKYTTPSDTVTATYDDQDRMLTYGVASYSYSKRGDLQRKIVGTDTTTYNYDNRGNLRSITLPDGTNIEYLIDGQDRRVAKKVNGQIIKRWLYADGLMPIAELDSTGSVEKRYGPGFIVKNDTTYRVIKDHLGSVRMVVNSQTGEVVQRIDYDAWGNITNLQNPDEFTDIGFAGGLYDRHTGLIRFGARDYDPQTGRWTAKDPILFDGGASNLYEYVFNDPINKVDLNGLEPCDQGLGMSALLSSLGYSSTAVTTFIGNLLDKADIGLGPDGIRLRRDKVLLSRIKALRKMVSTKTLVKWGSRFTTLGRIAGTASIIKSISDIQKGKISKTEGIMDITFGSVSMMGWQGAVISTGYFGPKYYYEYTTGKKMYPDNIFLNKGR